MPVARGRGQARAGAQVRAGRGGAGPVGGDLVRGMSAAWRALRALRLRLLGPGKELVGTDQFGNKYFRVPQHETRAGRPGGGGGGGAWRAGGSWSRARAERCLPAAAGTPGPAERGRCPCCCCPPSAGRLGGGGGCPVAKVGGLQAEEGSRLPGPLGGPVLCGSFVPHEAGAPAQGKTCGCHHQTSERRHHSVVGRQQ